MTCSLGSGSVCLQGARRRRPLLVIGPPVLKVEAAEAELVLRLPESFRTVLGRFSAHVAFRWFLPEDLQPPEPFREIFAGQCEWDLGELVRIEEIRRGWIQHVFSNSDDPYDRVWHNKLAFLDVGNGDQIALDPNETPSPVVYLSHEDGLCTATS